MRRWVLFLCLVGAVMTPACSPADERDGDRDGDGIVDNLDNIHARADATMNP